MDGRKQQRSALALIRAAEAVFPRQRKAAAAKEFKSAALESKRRQKKERGRREQLAYFVLKLGFNSLRGHLNGG